MKIVAFNGSPRKKGNTAFLLQKLVELLREQGHTCKTVSIYEKKILGCIACNACTQEKVPICVHEDDFTTKLAKEIIAADAIVIGSPVYMGQITGPLKTFLDRWYTFVHDKFQIRYVENKKFATIVTSGAPKETFAGVTEYLHYWFKDFFKMKPVGKIMAGDLMDDGSIKDRKDLIKEVEKLAKAFK